MKRKLFIILTAIFLIFLFAVGVSAASEYDSAGFDFKNAILISAGVALVVAFITVSILKGQLKSVRKQSGAGDYVKPGSFKLTRSNDFFLYRTVTKTERPKSNSGNTK